MKNRKDSVDDIRQFTYEKYGIFLNVTEVAEILKVSRYVIDRMLKAGQLPAIRLGGQYRERTDDLLSGWDDQIRQEQKNLLKKSLK